MNKEKSTLQAIVLAAGKGTRMKSELPKVLHTLCGRTLLSRSLHSLSELKPKRTLIVLGYKEDLVKAELQKIVEMNTLNLGEVVIVSQSEQNGTGHAVITALPDLDKKNLCTLIMPGDCPLIKPATLGLLTDGFWDNKDIICSFLTAKMFDPSGLGRVVRSANGNVQSIVEERDCTKEQLEITEINSSIYAVDTNFLCKALGEIKPGNSQGEYYLTDIIEVGVEEGLLVTAITVDNPLELVGANTRYELSVLESARRKEMLIQVMESGVTLENPDNVYIDEGVIIESDVFIGAGTRILGDSKISKGVHIEGNTRINNSSIGEDSYLRLNCYLTDSEVGSNCIIGPFAQLRPGTKLEDNVHIGNFVETKKSHLGKGTKANHLTYLGDTIVGENVNIGAGTITCNYDGTNKYQTQIDSGAFIGSNTSLVAPVKVGKGAVIGASSAITKDVPENSLALERSKQTTIKDWALRKKDK